MSRNKILMIVDDDSDDRYFFRDAVDQINTSYECWEASDGEQALRKLSASIQLPDFIFLDLNMPYMDGIQCLKELKADERLKHAPVIIYTTSSHQCDKDATSKLGAAHFIIKTGDVKSLPRIISEAMQLASRNILLL